MRFVRPRLRLSLRTLVVMVAALAVAMWAGLGIWSPTRRLGRLLQADQPAFVRREAASSLGHLIPPWEVDQAVSLLIKALDDPSPRVRENAGVGLAELGPRAGRAIPAVITALGDADRFARCSAAGTLGLIVTKGSPGVEGVVSALAPCLEDEDSYVRLAAAGALVKLGETRIVAGVVVAACVGSDPLARGWAQRIIREANDRRSFIAPLAGETRDRDARRRDEAVHTLEAIASPEEVRSILDSARAADDPGVREWAAAHLERIAPAP